MIKSRTMASVCKCGLSIAVLVIAGCGNFQLASGIQQAGKTPQQVQLDTLLCKDQAKLAANTADRQVGAFLLGMTIVGAPVAFELEKQKQREVFGECMTAKGYAITPAADDIKAMASPKRPSEVYRSPETLAAPSVLPSSTQSLPVPPATVSQAPTTTTTISRDIATSLEKLQSLHEKGLISDTEYAVKRKEILDRL